VKSKISQNYPRQLIFSVENYTQFTMEVKVMTIIQKYYNNGVNTEWIRMDRHTLEFEIIILVYARTLQILKTLGEITP